MIKYKEFPKNDYLFKEISSAFDKVDFKNQELTSKTSIFEGVYYSIYINENTVIEENDCLKQIRKYISFKISRIPRTKW